MRRRACCGRTAIFARHAPLADAGRFAARQGDPPFVIEGSYLESRRFEARLERDGLEMTFCGRTYPLETYSRALEAVDLRIEALREPAMPSEEVERRPDEGRWRRLPMFLMSRAAR